MNRSRISLWQRLTDRLKELAGMNVPVVATELDDTQRADDEGRRIGFPPSASVPKRHT